MAREREEKLPEPESELQQHQGNELIHCASGFVGQVLGCLRGVLMHGVGIIEQGWR